ncbi:hypothetical protein [Streptosporangium canum]|uniref:hypothetical protein n=1 Tax=Streptosporangium canum TaxID=324952 RepID=UPI00344844A1
MAARAALQAFQRAVETGELQSLLDVLAPDVVALSDGGGVRHALLRPVVGIDNVARLLAVGWWERDAERSTELVQINGGPGLLVRVDGEIDGVVAVRVENGYVTGAHHVRNPEKLSRVERETAGRGRQGGPEAPVRLAGNPRRPAVRSPGCGPQWRCPPGPPPDT